MKEWYQWAAFTALCVGAALGYVVGHNNGSSTAIETRDSREHWEMELELADVKSRLATLERIGVEIDVKDKTNTWFVLGGRTQE